MSEGPIPVAISWGFRHVADERWRDMTIDAVDQRDGSVKFAVRHGRSCLGRDGAMLYEPQPSSRTDEFIAHTRFATFEEAVAIAHAWMAKVTKDDLDEFGPETVP